MCIVSFYKVKNAFHLTFNRDERSGRPSVEPHWHTYENQSIFCPLDLEANGTWIGYNTNIIACLQNGSEATHVRHTPYELSRGIVLKTLLATNAIQTVYDLTSQHKIEPFTLSVYTLQSSSLTIYRYNGHTFKLETSDLDQPVLLCSSTLYNPLAQIEVREALKKIDINKDSIFKFHESMCIGKPLNTYTNLVDTVSITQFSIENGSFNSRYLDCIHNLISEHSE